MKLSLRNIIRWELLSNTSFYAMNYTDYDHVTALLYVCNNSPLTLEAYRKAQKPTELEQQIKELEQQIEHSSQFRYIAAEQPHTESTPPKSATHTATIGDTVAQLIVGGVPATFLLDEVSISELPLYITAFERKQKRELEEARLWTFLTIRPHISSKTGIRTPQDLHPFGWENTKAKGPTKEELAKGMAMFDGFFNSDRKDF